MKKTNVTVDMELSGKKIHAAIKGSGYSIRELQEMLYLECPQSIYRWIHGYTLPSIDNLYRLSVILRVSIEDLLAVKGEEN
uniref:HTH cro/C1-type domain-containing protein n=1 Tax=uncultured prokaryote TaxID=198431 RepID=A0A0H5Q208_9ZZZZ|nr:hypothetical protein [uncultured prokaryote]